MTGAAAAIYESFGHKPGKVDQDFIELYTNEARAEIGDEAFEAAYSNGRSMTMEDAIAFARKVVSDNSAATQLTNKTSSKITNIPTNDAFENEKTIFLPTTKTNAEISHRNNFLSLISRKKVLVTSLIFFVMAAASLFSYNYLITNRQIRSIAVMPFFNDSNNKDVEYLADGMTENLISSLSNIPNLSVKARNTVFSYKGKEISPEKIGKELNVDAVLLGHLVQQGDDLKLNLELVDTATQNLLWSENYQSKLNDLVFLQSEIARNISDNLRLRLTKADQEKVGKTYTMSSEAQQNYLRGRFHWNKRNLQDFEKAIEYFNQAIEKDPNYASAHAGLADTYSLIPLYGNFRPREYMPKAKQSAQKALELDANLAEAHASLGRILNSYDFDWKGAEREYKKAIELNPNYATAHQWYAEHLAFREMTDEAIKEISIALELDPFSLVINRMQGNIFVFAQRYDEGIAQLKKTIELYPENALVRFNLGDAFAAKGMHSEAVEQYLVALRLRGETFETIQNFEDAYKKKGWNGFWDEYLENRLELRKSLLAKDQTTFINNESIAYAYAATKNKNKALEYLNMAYHERETELITIKKSEVYDFLSEDPQFKQLILNIGLPE